MSDGKERIEKDFSLALRDLNCRGLAKHPLFQELSDAEKELLHGVEMNYHIDWNIVDIDESHIYVTNLKTGKKYHISVIYPAALYVDVYRILENGEEISPWNYVPFDWSMVTDKTLWLTPCEESYYYVEKWRREGRKSVLDMGCGLGRHSILFAKNGFDVTALDISEEALSFLEKDADKQGLKISCVLARMESMPFPDRSFDCIFAMHSAGHTYTAGMYKNMSEIMRVLKPGGAIFITLCSKETWTFTESGILKVDANTVIKTDGPEQGVPHFFADKDDIKKLFSGFELVSVRHIDDCYSEGKWRNQKHYFIEAKKCRCSSDSPISPISS